MGRVINWFKKEEKPNPSAAAIEDLLLKLSSLKFEVQEVANKTKILETGLDDLRGKFNRKLSKIANEEAQKQEIPQNINTFGSNKFL